MADKIYVETDRLDYLASQIKKVATLLGDCSRDINRIHLDKSTGANIRVSANQKMETTAYRISASNADQLLKAASKSLNSLQDFASSKVISIGSVSEILEDNERKLTARVNGTLDNSDDEKLCRFLNIGTNSTLWTPEMRQAYENFKKCTVISQEGNTTLLQNQDGTVYLYEGYMLLGTEKITMSATEYKKTVELANVTKEDSIKLTVGDFIAKNKIIKQDDFASKHEENGKPVKDRKDETDADAFKDRFSLITIGASTEISHSVFLGDKTFETKDGRGSAEASYDILKSEFDASIEAGLYSVKVGADGKEKRVLSPGISAKMGASVTAVETELSGKYEIIDGIASVDGKVTTTIGKVSGKGEAKLGIVDGNVAAYAGAEFEAIAVEATAAASVDVMGVKATGEVGVNFGLGGHAEIGFNDGKIVFDAGLSVGLGVSAKGEIDVSGFIDNVAEKVDRLADGAKKAEKVFKNAGEAIGRTIGRGLSGIAHSILTF